MWSAFSPKPDSALEAHGAALVCAETGSAVPAVVVVDVVLCSGVPERTRRLETALDIDVDVVLEARLDEKVGRAGVGARLAELVAVLIVDTGAVLKAGTADG